MLNPHQHFSAACVTFGSVYQYQVASVFRLVLTSVCWYRYVTPGLPVCWLLFGVFKQRLQLAAVMTGDVTRIDPLYSKRRFWHTQNLTDTHSSAGLLGSSPCLLHGAAERSCCCRVSC